MKYRFDTHLTREEADEGLRSGGLSVAALRASGLYSVTVPAENYRGEHATATFVPREGDGRAVVVKTYADRREARAQYVAGRYIHASLADDEQVYAPQVYDLIEADDASYMMMEYLADTASLESPYTHPWTSPMAPDEVRALQAEAKQTVRASLRRSMSPLAFRLMANDIGQRNNLANILHDTASEGVNRFAVIDRPNLLGKRDVARAHAIVRYFGPDRL